VERRKRRVVVMQQLWPAKVFAMIGTMKHPVDAGKDKE
jgi:hypothetical protein